MESYVRSVSRALLDYSVASDSSILSAISLVVSMVLRSSRLLLHREHFSPSPVSFLPTSVVSIWLLVPVVAVALVAVVRGAPSRAPLDLSSPSRL